MNKDDVRYWTDQLEMIDDALAPLRCKLRNTLTDPMTRGDEIMLRMHLEEQAAIVHHLKREVRRPEKKSRFDRILRK